MTDDPTTGESIPGVCPWCSAPLAATDTVTCSSCGARLQGEGDQPLPGLTAIDPVAVIEGVRAPQRPRSRLVAWLTGADIEEGMQQPASPEALAPPPPEVQREMLRLQMEAELTQLSAEVESLATDEAVAAHEEGDTARAQAALAAVLGADATTESINEAAELAAAEAELAAATSPAETDVGAAEPDVGAAEPDAEAAGATSAGVASPTEEPPAG